MESTYGVDISHVSKRLFALGTSDDPGPLYLLEGEGQEEE
jgi:hypothetical protein